MRDFWATLDGVCVFFPYTVCIYLGLRLEGLGLWALGFREIQGNCQAGSYRVGTLWLSCSAASDELNPFCKYLGAFLSSAAERHRGPCLEKTEWYITSLTRFRGHLQLDQLRLLVRRFLGAHSSSCRGGSRSSEAPDLALTVA